MRFKYEVFCEIGSAEIALRIARNHLIKNDTIAAFAAIDIYFHAKDKQKEIDSVVDLIYKKYHLIPKDEA